MLRSGEKRTTSRGTSTLEVFALVNLIKGGRRGVPFYFFALSYKLGDGIGPAASKAVAGLLESLGMDAFCVSCFWRLMYHNVS